MLMLKKLTEVFNPNFVSFILPLAYLHITILLQHLLRTVGSHKYCDWNSTRCISL